MPKQKEARLNRTSWVLAIVIVVLFSQSPLSALESEKDKGPQASSVEDSQAKTPLTFKLWRERQIAEAKNHVVRRSNRLQLAANGGLGLSSEDFNFDKEERSLNEAIEALQHAEERSDRDYFEIYLEVYLSQFKGKPESLELLMQSISAQEGAEILGALLKRRGPGPSSSLGAALKGLPSIQ